VIHHTSSMPDPALRILEQVHPPVGSLPELIQTILPYLEPGFCDAALSPRADGAAERERKARIALVVFADPELIQHTAIGVGGTRLKTE